MIRTQLIIIALITGISAVAVAPDARAEDSVTYEVVSNDVAAANLEYFDSSERKVLDGVPLPWRTTVTVMNALSPSVDGAEVRADWRPRVCDGRAWCPEARPNNWVTVRIYFRGKVICESTLDVGNAACYGSTSFKS
ncbi:MULTISPECIES: MmpS family transport accessory protein [Mycobacterium]|uniref:Secreted protein n=2 Tax=Mycobacterium avium complex (MAC) TaxID=120793 RepID=A0A7I9ZD27_9MYCO|nr:MULTISPECIES: MmpS family transport accessory protein [Mycobacterium]MCA2249431.1 hypothetical protein [Mycobacterium intracellulare]MCA2355639.1 hypothetical protein [Mycobacterium intracellulare]MCA2364977.1 hypothetical protein [Mycobacterium intracellulare]MCV7116694.1 hypothetical protein [Mycobacterium nebraskense]PBA54527.1 hypothetical protein CKJ57_07260 [Mycobacterium intracellulare subsp. chimaera]